MNYQEAMAFLEETKHYGIVPGLSNIRRLCGKLHDPQEQLAVVHIAGTNGKGAVGKLIASALSVAGIKTGHFSTPDVFFYEEIFQIDGKMIEKQALADLFFDIQAACREIVAEGYLHPTKFEVETAAAFLWFYREGCRYAVIECGMGGIEDATNLITSPKVCVFTKIGMDHTQYLGKTREEIIRNKAGIIKPGCSVVMQGPDYDALSILSGYCRKYGCTLTSATARGVETDIAWKEPTRSDFFYCGELYTIRLGGIYQIDNAVTALEAIAYLRQDLPELTTEAVQEAFRNAVWPGRFEQIGTEPDFILDGAHNPSAAMSLRESLRVFFTDRKIVYIMGVLADKEYEEVARIMLNAGDTVFCVTSKSPRALPAEELAACLRGQEIDARIPADMDEAVKQACREAGRGGVVVAFGTLSHLGDLREAYLKIL